MGVYPGLGLPLRHWPAARSVLRNRPLQYPTAAHPNVRGSDSEMLPVREVAMMGVMNSLTDKKDWHKKVFDEAIVEKWREEAMAIPDQNLMTAAAAPSSDWYRAGPVDVGTEPRPENTSTRVEGIMSKAAFDYVRIWSICTYNCQSADRIYSASKSCRAKLVTSRKLLSYQHLMHLRLS